METWQIYNVLAAIPHPEFKPPSKYHDIALLVSDKWIPFSPVVLPACLSTGGAQDQAYATGWGATGHREALADTLQTGDSGGPLQVRSEISSCVHTVIGVTSHGKPCGFAGGSGVYTRVEYYVPWIESIVWP
ncbi:hypothetical protein HF086_016099 [Spodoptera exigua]|uniref:Peptidase S1 domain-containing protein n=1 Tax=Spodoptera exigua TaxID=7107 RepID=A0A922M5M2_SPOEX|nr:hypothetical protein HF086_016099 [Spodoptera exigua]